MRLSFKRLQVSNQLDAYVGELTTFNETNTVKVANFLSNINLISKKTNRKKDGLH